MASCLCNEQLQGIVWLHASVRNSSRGIVLQPIITVQIFKNFRDHLIVHLSLNVSSSANNCGYVVDGSEAMVAI